MTRAALAATILLAVALAACTGGRARPDTAAPDDVPAVTGEAQPSATDRSAPADDTVSEIAARAAEIAAAVDGAAGPAPHDGPFFFSLALDGLTWDEHEAFVDGQFFFNEIWTEVGPRETPSDGLGPLFNAQSCDACHRASGRRAATSSNGTVNQPGLLVRLSVPGDSPEPNYGDQFQDRSLGQRVGEGIVAIEWIIETGNYDDGVPWERRRPVLNLVNLTGPDLDEGTLTSIRSAAPLIGMGFLEAVPASVILEAADPDDVDGDGISGRPNMVLDPRTGDIDVGRFGWKAGVATLEHQTALAFNGDIGVTSRFLPEENCSETQNLCANTQSGGSFEVDDERIDATLTYLRGLAVPEAAANDRGARLFREFGCASCHREQLTTGPASLDVLSNVTITPYTDLLLHDMGDGLADGRPEADADGREWRTPPLWGLGQIPSGPPANLLHDGRARTVEEAILWHGGEADPALQAWLGASAEDRAALLAFLDQL